MRRAGYRRLRPLGCLLWLAGACAPGPSSPAPAPTASASSDAPAPAAAPASAPDRDYLVFVASEGNDRIALVRYGPRGIAVERERKIGTNPTELVGPHGLFVSPDGRWYYVTTAPQSKAALGTTPPRSAVLRDAISRCCARRSPLSSPEMSNAWNPAS